MQDTFKSGFVCIIGRANVGKSTFVNRVIGKKVAITSYKPQTTRNRVLGIKTTDTYQIAFTDTPGVHKPTSLLDERMQDAAYGAIHGVDAVIFMTTPLKEVLHGDRLILEKLKSLKIPVYLVINKIDILKKQSDIDLTILLYKDLMDFAGIFPISVQNDVNIDYLLNEIVAILPYGPMYYPKEMHSDHSQNFLMAEMIREKILLLTNEEVPHSVAVLIDYTRENEENPEYLDIFATIFVDRSSQKKIIIGKNGDMIKQIKQKSLGDIKRLLGRKVHLDLWIKVKEKWRDNAKDLNSLGYSESI